MQITRSSRWLLLAAAATCAHAADTYPVKKWAKVVAVSGMTAE